MEWWLVLSLLLGALLLLMALGLPVAFCFLAINFVGATLIWGGEAGLSQYVLSIRDSVASWSLLPIPMFILVGEIIFHSGIGLRVIDILDRWLGRMPGRLAILSLGSATVFSATSGSTIGTTGMLGALLAPQMEERGYAKSMSIGPIIGAGGLAMIVPPSSLAVVLASVAQISVGRLLIAGVVPGFALATLYAIYIIVRCKLQPGIAPVYAPATSSKRGLLKNTLFEVAPLGLVVFAIVGFIILGIATATEAAATGALAALLLAAVHGRVSREMLGNTLTGTLKLTVMTMMILTGATGFSQLLAFSGASQGMLESIVALELAPVLIVALMLLILLALGSFMSAIAIMMISLPIYMPIITELGFSQIWFGILVLLVLEMSQTTPPFGVLLYVMKGVMSSETSVSEIFRAGAPFLASDLAVVVLVLLMPAVALWLPGMVG